MKGQWSLIFALFVTLVIAIFSVVNVNTVTFNYVFGKTGWPLILIILGSVFMGALIVGLIGLVKVYQLQKQIKQLKRELANQTAQTHENEINPDFLKQDLENSGHENE